MLDVTDNLFNRRRSREESKLKLWRYAGLMLTYRCSAACRFCYYSCDSRAGGLMPVETAIAAWKGLVRIAGETANVHITGGEPFLYFDRLIEILQQARQDGLTPADMIETNGSWAVDESEIADKLRQLDALGMDRLKISWDAFHEEFIDVENVCRLVAVGRKVLGNDRVLVRWEHHLDHPTGIRTADETARRAILKAALETDPCRLTGRAADALADLSEQFPVETFFNHDCQTALLGSKGVHIDPAGNVFNGQCSGMIVGNVNGVPLDEMWMSFEPDKEEFWRTLFETGPSGFLKKPCCTTYPKRLHYGSKCHLCSDIRRFFFDKGHFSQIIGPIDCYDKR